MTLHSPFIHLKMLEYLKFSLVNFDLNERVFNGLSEMLKISDTGTSPARVRSKYKFVRCSLVDGFSVGSFEIMIGSVSVEAGSTMISMDEFIFTEPRNL